MVKKLDKVEVVVVGSGWAGGIVAAELTKKGYKVVGLERGKDQDAEDFIGSKDELRYNSRQEMYQDLTKETLTTRNTPDETASPRRDSAINGTDTGGTSVHWNGHTYRFPPFDFKIRSEIESKYGEDRIPKDMTIQDWGITYEELEPYYDKFEKTAGISGEENPLGPERSEKYPNPPLKESSITRLVKDGAKELGYHPYHIPSANMSQDYENPDGETINACVYCSYCENYGCDFGAKADPIVTVLPTAKKTGNYELRNDAYVTRVLHDKNRATGVLYVDPQTGEEYEQPADLVVLAGFTFTNTRLLLLSEIGEPYDVNSGTGVIGKNFTSHYANLSYARVTAFFEEKKFNNFAGAGSLGVTIDDFGGDVIDNTDLDFLHGFHFYVNQSGANPITSNNTPEGTPAWGKEFKEKSLFYANRNIEMGMHEGVLPRQHNYLDLDSNYKDVFGDPLLRITVKYTDQERNLQKYARKKAKEIFEKMGADHINVPEITEETEFNEYSTTNHCAGGVIMGEEPETSAVNNYSQIWDMENLFVIGASSFAHFGHYNPTGTVGALAYRAAEGIDEYLKNGGGLLVKAEHEKKTI